MKARMIILSIVILSAMLLCSCGEPEGDSQVLDPPAAPSIPVLPADSEFDNVIVNAAQEGDVEQIEFGTPGKDKIEQYGGTGTTTQYAEGAANDDWILQVGGR